MERKGGIILYGFLRIKTYFSRPQKEFFLESGVNKKKAESGLLQGEEGTRERCATFRIRVKTTNKKKGKAPLRGRNGDNVLTPREGKIKYYSEW